MFFLLDSWTLDFMINSGLVKDVELILFDVDLSTNEREYGAFVGFKDTTHFDEVGETVVGDDCFVSEVVRFVEKKDYSVWVERIGDKVIVGRCSGRINNNNKARRDDVSEKERERRDSDNLKRSCKRAYKRVVDCIGGAKCDRMLTLTFQENVVDVDIALIAFQKFVALAYEEFGHFDYVAVPERQKRGAIHYHIALNRFLPWKRVLELWRRGVAMVSSLTGGIDIRKKDVDQKRGESKIAALARYIAKYVSKSFYCTDFDANTIGRKRYYSNMRVAREVVKITSRDDDVLICSLGSDGKECDFVSILCSITDLSISFIKKYSFVSVFCGFSYRYETPV